MEHEVMPRTAERVAEGVLRQSEMAGLVRTASYAGAPTRRALRSRPGTVARVAGAALVDR